MAKKLLGLCTCPECHFDGAEVKETKAALAYRWCPECLAQYFPRQKAASDRLISKCHTVPEAEESQEPEKTPEPAPAPAKAPVLTVVPKPEPKPIKVAKVGPFDFLLNKGAQIEANKHQ